VEATGLSLNRKVISMQIFSVQFADGVALINHNDCYDDTSGFFVRSDGETIAIEPQEPPARPWTRRSRLCKTPDSAERCKPFVNRNGGRKPATCK